MGAKRWKIAVRSAGLAVWLTCRGWCADAPSAAQVQPLKVVQTTDVLSPETFEPMDPPAGEATALVHVDADGRLLDVLVTHSSRTLYGNLAEKALREWRYEPARRNGQPIAVRQTVRLVFEPRRAVVTLTPMATLDRLVARAGGAELAAHLSTGAELDRPLQPVSVVSPLPVQEDDESESTMPARVVVDFIVDREGRPRMPAIVTATTPVHGASALQAVEQWRFEPPLRAGRPVAVRVQQEFRFEAPSS